MVRMIDAIDGTTRRIREGSGVGFRLGRNSTGHWEYFFFRGRVTMQVCDEV